MNFFKYLFKKVLLVLLGLFLITSLSYVVIFPFINNASLINQPIMNQYFKFLGSIFHSFGQVYHSSSFSNASEYFFYYYKWSLLFEGLTFFFSIIIGFLIGIFLAYKNKKLSEVIVNFIIFLLAAIPTFILAPLILILAEAIDLPVNFILPSNANFGFTLLSSLLPVALLSISAISYYAIIIKNATLKILKQEYITVLKTSGQSSTSIFFKGVFKNLIAATINQVLSMIIIIISFSLILERIFQIPGQSLILTTAFENGEINVLMCLIFYKALLLFTLGLIFEVTSDILQVDNGLNLYYTINFGNVFKKHALLEKGVQNE
ncbi:ABC transporter permease subunit [Mycoplasmopsis adleri]|uniref:ABC transporter permease subunit n=1 Tax=Mycoplasmopsis adleri TaxID=51362 RepID=UPI003873B798